jgi:chromosomal replication initiator protein
VKAYAELLSDPRKGRELPFPSGQESSSVSDAVQIKNRLKGHLDTEMAEAWFSPLSFSLSSEHTLTVSLPHELFFRWFCEAGRKDLERAVGHCFGTMAITYVWPGHNSTEKETRTGRSPKPVRQNAPTFEEFIPGGRNRESILLLRRSLHALQGPVFLHGLSGTGKSHLLQASASELGTLVEGKVRLFSGRDILSLFRNSTDRAHAELSACSAVLVDDMQILEGHTDIQKELAAFLDAEKHIFFLAAYQTDGNDESGQKLLPLLYDRLCSKLSLGLAEPDLDVRLRFTQATMEKLGLPEQRELALHLSRHCLRLRHIQGVLEQIRMSYEQSPVLPEIGELSSLLGRAGVPQPVDSSTILAVVASRYGCTSSELCENTKDRHITLPRQIAMFLCRELLGESYPSIGLLFGGKDHSTVMYATKKIEKLKVTNKDMNIQLTELTKQCRNGLPRRDY